MKTMTFISTLIGGLVAGIALTLSCGDNPKPADAADGGTCNCPAAEPPIASRIVEARKDFTLPANSSRNSGSVVCPGAGPYVVINGGCTANINDSVMLMQSFPDGPGATSTGWTCAWNNLTNADVMVTAIVHCLTPPQ
jgi:hypothetical protein